MPGMQISQALKSETAGDDKMFQMGDKHQISKHLLNANV